MQISQYDRFTSALTAVAEMHGKQLSEGVLLMWWEALKGYDLEQVEEGLAAHVRNPDAGQWMPKPSDIIREIDGGRKDRASLAWSKAYDGMSRVGAYTSVAFDDPIIHAVIEDVGGWVKVCRTGGDDLGYLQHRFCEAYRAYAGRPSVNYPQYLVGEHEANNALKGHKSPPPVLIGDPAKAQMVITNGSALPKTQITQGMQTTVDFAQALALGVVMGQS